MRLSAYETYCLYLAIKSHFTTQSYDYHKYQGKVKASKESFDIRKDRFLFQKLSRKYSNDQMNDFLISNCIKGKKWVGEFLDDDAENIRIAKQLNGEIEGIHIKTKHVKVKWNHKD